MSLARLSASDRRAVAAATLAAGLLIAQQVAARAVRDALFLSAFQVKSLPLVMGASALAALAGAELLSLGLSRTAPVAARPGGWRASRPSCSPPGGRSVSPRRGPPPSSSTCTSPPSAGRSSPASGRWSTSGSTPTPRAGWSGGSPPGASAGGVGRRVPGVGRLARPAPARPPSCSCWSLTATAGAGALRGAGAGRTRSPPERAPAAPPLALPLLLRNPYVRNIALVVLLGAVVEALVDFLFKGLAAARFAAGGARSSGPFGAFHGVMSVVGLLLQTTASRAALRHLGIAGTVALRPAFTAVELDPRRHPPRLRHRHLRPRRARVAHELALPVRLRAALHAGARGREAPGEGGDRRLGGQGRHAPGQRPDRAGLRPRPGALGARPVRDGGRGLSRRARPVAPPAPRLRADPRAEPPRRPGPPRPGGRRRPGHPGHPRAHGPARPRHAPAPDRGAARPPRGHRRRDRAAAPRLRRPRRASAEVPSGDPALVRPALRRRRSPSPPLVAALVPLLASDERLRGRPPGAPPRGPARHRPARGRAPRPRRRSRGATAHPPGAEGLRHPAGGRGPRCGARRPLVRRARSAAAAALAALHERSAVVRVAREDVLAPRPPRARLGRARRPPAARSCSRCSR